jgi:hypothetical protein
MVSVVSACERERERERAGSIEHLLQMWNKIGWGKDQSHWSGKGRESGVAEIADISGAEQTKKLKKESDTS